MRGLFGQEKWEIGKSCPNAGLIRTGEAENRKKLSEFGAYSDRWSGKSEKAVRMPCRQLL
ncbi:hypothetical protein KW850_15600 [Bacillus sp. sid0103]|uniref:hypothetical protein n=1 Tax=Bacillus sp. sid0103 TaxID=2856337 RepID=UPI001C449232|nr:hypothetical protein [Bacillus sp. sid0103]MBV7506689.1 hypothetical protein [Bacillus sp. sid0103]